MPIHKKTLTKILLDEYPELLEEEAVEILCFLLVANLLQRGKNDPSPVFKEIYRMWRKSVDALASRHMQPKGEA